MDDSRRPISWEVELESDDRLRQLELEQWADDNDITLEKQPPRGKGRDVYDPKYRIVYVVKLTTWDKNLALMGKLMWGGHS